MTVAIILAAYQARADWLQQCLESIDASAALVPAVAVDVRIGIDGCDVTARILRNLGRAAYWSAENVGTYIVRNSLLHLAPADAYVIFDADDVMRPSYLSVVTRMLTDHAIVGPSREECDAQLAPQRFADWRNGVCAFRHEVLARLGGYHAERLGADVDFIARARAARFRPAPTGQACYLRRRHAGSLTLATETGFGSAAREQARKRMRQLRESAGARVYVRPVTVPLEMRPARQEVA